MHFITALFFGFLTALVGVLPPGLINMTAAKVHHKEGIKNAMWFVFGALVIVAVQIFLAVFFAKIINSRPDFVILLREIGFVIFTLLTVYFLAIAKTPKEKSQKLKKKSKEKRFFLGMLLSVLNFFPIPYYAFVCVTLASLNLFIFDSASVFGYVSGVVLGSFLVFYLYIYFFDRIEAKKDFIMRNMNNIIGCFTGLFALIALINIINYYL